VSHESKNKRLRENQKAQKRLKKRQQNSERKVVNNGR
jgi:hypothetical protein